LFIKQKLRNLPSADEKDKRAHAGVIIYEVIWIMVQIQNENE